EEEAARGEAAPERADREAADRDPLAPRRQPLPAPERLLLLFGQRFAAALLTHGAAGAQTEIEVVENLRRLLVSHLSHCIACFAGVRAHPSRLGPARRRPRRS